MSDMFSAGQRAAERPVAAFFVVLVGCSTLVAGALFSAFGRKLPGAAAILYAWTPLISAGATVWMVDGSVRDWLGQIRNFRVGVHWYLIGAAVMMIGTEFENIAAVLLGADVTVPAFPLIAYVLQFILTLFIAGALEEFAWRGFLQPRLQEEISALSASVVTGVVWAVWHIPMILGGAGNFTVFWEYVLNVVAISVVLGWVYNGTKGALPVVMIAHAAHNMPPVVSVTDSVPVFFTLVSGDTVFYLLCALLIALYTGARTLTRNDVLPAVPGRGEETSLHQGNTK